MKKYLWLGIGLPVVAVLIGAYLAGYRLEVTTASEMHKETAVRRFVVLLCILCGLTAGAIAAPQALVLNDSTLVAVRPVAQWLGADVQYDADTHTVVLQRAGMRVALPFNRRAATLGDQPLALSVPALSSGATTYVPVRALVAAFGVTATWTAKTRALTLTQADAVPFTVTTDLFPRPACVRDDTLAGLTPGDHLALAVALWGDPTGGSASAIPGATEYRFSTGNDGLLLTVAVRRDAVVMIATQLTIDPHAVPSATLRAAASGHGWRLGQPATPAYRRPRHDFAIASTDTAIENYVRRSLTLLVRSTYFGERGAFQPVEHRLIRRPFPRRWVRPI